MKFYLPNSIILLLLAAIALLSCSKKTTEGAASDSNCGWHLIDTLQWTYDSIWVEGYFGEEGSYLVDSNKTPFYGYSKDGKTIKTPLFKEALPYSQCIAAAKPNKLWGYLGENGKWLVKPKFVVAESFKNGKANAIIADDTFWYDVKLNKKGNIVWQDKVGRPIPTYFDSLENWQVMLSSAKDYVRLADEETAAGYFAALYRRKDEIAKEDTLATMEILCRHALMCNRRYEMHHYQEAQADADLLFNQVIKTDIVRKRLITLEYLEHLQILSEVYQARDQDQRELAILKKMMAAVKSAGEDPEIYWDVRDRIVELEKG
ncbi:MAG: WG repeat-containing protein [Bacteroidetes bacterium]|nr:WG repeat-containing protein [Bacteroidota bacterium]